MARFKKKSAKLNQEIPTASLPDIVFMLLIFFMVTTVLREQDMLVRTQLPEAEAIEKIEQKRLISYVWIGPRRLDGNRLGDTAVQIDDAIIDDIGSIRNIMYSKLLEQPRLIVSLRVDEDAQMGFVQDVQNELRHGQTLRINYSTKRLVPR